MSNNSRKDQGKSKTAALRLLPIAGLVALGTIPRKMYHVCNVCGEVIATGQGYRVHKEKGIVHTTCIVSTDAKKERTEN